MKIHSIKDYSIEVDLNKGELILSFNNHVKTFSISIPDSKKKILLDERTDKIGDDLDKYKNKIDTFKANQKPWMKIDGLWGLIFRVLN